MGNLVVKPPETKEVKGPVIFLAGPIQGAPDWQQEAIEIFDTLSNDLVVASPRKNYKPEEFVYEKQVDWETHYLRRAARLGAIMFWLANQTEETPGRSYAQTSRLELGEWKRRHETDGVNLVVGIEDGFGNSRYIRRRFSQDCPGVPLLDNLQATCEVVLEKLAV